MHMIDNLGGRLGSFDRLEKELPDGSRWSAYDRALGGGAWFAARRPPRPIFAGRAIAGGRRRRLASAPVTGSVPVAHDRSSGAVRR